MELVIPIVHLNGTSRESLIDNLSEVYNALEDVRGKLKQAAPNGRDYYPDPGRMDLAVAQHRRRLSAIDALQNEIEAEMEAISEAGSFCTGRG